MTLLNRPPRGKVRCIERLTFRRVQPIAFIVHHEIEHGTFREVRWLVDQEPTILHTCANR